jgi:hypothetical protein
MGGALPIVRSDLLDEFWYVDARRTAFRTGSVITEKTAVRIDQRRILRFERRMDIAEVLRIFGIREAMWDDGHKNRFS